MSKRFGRNQKRRLITQLQEVESAIENCRIGAERDSRLYREKTARYQQYFEDTARILGNDFIAERRQMGIDDHQVRSGQMRMHKMLHLDPASFMSPMDVAQTVAITVQELEFNGKQVRIDELRGQIMIRYSTPHGDAGIALSADAWMRTPVEIIAREISTDIANYIIKRLTQIRQEQGIRA